MNALIVGGNFGVRKPSGLVWKIAECFFHENVCVINGGLISELPCRIDEDQIKQMLEEAEFEMDVRMLG